MSKLSSFLHMSRWITTLPPTQERSYKHALGPVLTQFTKMSDQCSQVLLIKFNHNEFNAAVRSYSNSCEIRHFSYASLLREEHFLSSSPLKTAELAQSLHPFTTLIPTTTTCSVSWWCVHLVRSKTVICGISHEGDFTTALTPR